MISCWPSSDQKTIPATPKSNTGAHRIHQTRLDWQLHVILIKYYIRTTPNFLTFMDYKIKNEQQQTICYDLVANYKTSVKDGSILISTVDGFWLQTNNPNP